MKKHSFNTHQNLSEEKLRTVEIVRREIPNICSCNRSTELLQHLDRWCYRVEMMAPKSCWIWGGGFSRTKVPQPIFEVPEHSGDQNYRGMSARRFIYELCWGELPKDILVTPKCNNEECVSPYHLQIQPLSQLLWERKKNEMNLKLAKEDVEVIKQLYEYGNSQYRIAKLFNISQPLVSMILNGRAWVGVK